MRQLFFVLTIAFAMFAGNGMLKLTQTQYNADTIPDQFASAFDPSEHRVSKLTSTGMQDLFVIERPWLPNPNAPAGLDAGLSNISAVPTGEYILFERDSPSKGLQWHFFNPQLAVYLDKSDCPDINPETGDPESSRFSTMYHLANFVRNVEGCGGPGLRLHNFGGTDGLGVASSADGIIILKAHLSGSKIAQLTIV